MLAVAGFFDLANFIFEFVDGGSISGWVISAVNWLTFGLWFLFKGVKYTKNSDIAITGLVAIIIGFIPVINAVPEYIAAVARIIMSVQKSDGYKGLFGKEPLVPEVPIPARPQNSRLNQLRRPVQRRVSTGESSPTRRTARSDAHAARAGRTNTAPLQARSFDITPQKPANDNSAAPRNLKESMERSSRRIAARRVVSQRNRRAA